MKSLWILMFLAQPVGLFVHDQDERPIKTASELRDWCKAVAEAEIIGRGGTPSNWSARYWDEGQYIER